MTHEHRYINLALINLGEALTEIANQMQRNDIGTIEGKDFGRCFGSAQIALDRAKAALKGETYIPPPDQKNITRG